MAGIPLHADVRFWRRPELPGVEARSSSYSRRAFRTHTHETYSVALILAGSTRFALNGELHAAGPGQLVAIGPGEPHSCNPDTGADIAYRLFYLAPGWLKGASADNAPPRFRRPVLDDPELFALWDALFGTFTGAGMAGIGEAQALLLAALRELVARHAEPAGGADQESARQAGQAGQAGQAAAAVARARRRLAGSPGSFVPLCELAGEAGLSPHHFLRVFKAATGLPPHRYQMQQAVEHAKRLLADGAPISQAALDAGFADQSHFSRIFREFTGATPGQYLGGKP